MGQWSSSQRLANLKSSQNWEVRRWGLSYWALATFFLILMSANVRILTHWIHSFKCKLGLKSQTRNISLAINASGFSVAFGFTDDSIRPRIPSITPYKSRWFAILTWVKSESQRRVLNTISQLISVQNSCEFLNHYIYFYFQAKSRLHNSRPGSKPDFPCGETCVKLSLGHWWVV